MRNISTTIRLVTILVVITICLSAKRNPSKLLRRQEIDSGNNAAQGNPPQREEDRDEGNRNVTKLYDAVHKYEGKARKLRSGARRHYLGEFNTLQGILSNTRNRNGLNGLSTGEIGAEADDPNASYLDATHGVTASLHAQKLQVGTQPDAAHPPSEDGLSPLPYYNRRKKQHILADHSVPSPIKVGHHFDAAVEHVAVDHSVAAPPTSMVGNGGALGHHGDLDHFTTNVGSDAANQHVVLDQHQHGILDQHQHGILDQHQHGILDQHQHGILDQHQPAVLNQLQHLESTNLANHVHAADMSLFANHIPDQSHGVQDIAGVQAAEGSHIDTSLLGGADIGHATAGHHLDADYTGGAEVQHALADQTPYEITKPPIHVGKIHHHTSYEEVQDEGEVKYHPCVNGGVFVSTGRHSYECICPEKFIGKNCQGMIKKYMYAPIRREEAGREGDWGRGEAGGGETYCEHLSTTLLQFVSAMALIVMIGAIRTLATPIHARTMGCAPTMERVISNAFAPRDSRAINVMICIIVNQIRVRMTGHALSWRAMESSSANAQTNGEEQSAIAAKVGLHCNSKKTEYRSFNQTVISQIRAQDGNTIKEVENFKYLGSWTQSSEKDIAVRKAVASQTQEDLDIQTTQNDEKARFCYENPCLNGGICQEGQDTFSCICTHGWRGKTCNDRACKPNPCKNSGTCSEVEDGKAFKCVCLPWHSGPLCEENRPCLTNPCLNGGKCIDSYSGYHWAYGPLQFYCLCKPPYQGERCELHGCRHCHKNAHCEVDKCVCDDGYKGDGRFCIKKEDPCHPNPCENDGICVQVEDTAEYSCQCKKPYLPPNCKLRDPCNPSPCKNDAVCSANGDGSYTCTCPAGTKGVDCETTDPCIPNPCQHSGTCQDNNGTATCECKGFWSKPFCKECSCPKKEMPGIPDVTCDPDGKCVCPTGWSLDSMLKICKKDKGGGGDGCQDKPCVNGGVCSPVGEKDYTCKCQNGYVGKNCQHKDACNPNPCKNGGTCLADKANPSKFLGCTCPKGFSVQPFCDKDKGGGGDNNNPCEPNPCKNEGQCVKKGKSYDCICIVRFTGPQCNDAQTATKRTQNALTEDANAKKASLETATSAYKMYQPAPKSVRNYPVVSFPLGTANVTKDTHLLIWFACVSTTT
eukprot:gene12275-13540_t